MAPTQTNDKIQITGIAKVNLPAPNNQICHDAIRFTDHGPAYPCYVLSDRAMKHGDTFLPNQLSQVFGHHAVNGITTYVYTTPKRNTQNPLDQGRDVLTFDLHS